ncbi:HAD-superfamily hydrolase, subfamily IA, variant 1 [Pseudarthrobacter chlorophenolicus A6]|uniref:HAD-superfamily hydrolase, subfamily IA, variant 1 n=1 Tax=Pseudarthrobacter chlorophenolicus (strain ATCC 700700 / DSM 12829 / CIP 107037 / JCM 12360 / KCTC 9906 / NCIMB 13794 / A6) TaxID=452863 RepID=B8HAD5_PSECP|nr:HAD family hydrolase [Pseudarthrobacter chlorophenolicus]ACL40227.1 HAD-superfamily hydrolase, subfamily IA, variant 1 [Pseudarthrobacter chlorophenolicus A6]SDQ85444.1 putative hydrolase of the HAD superfamily [Pseudarthrobacter chlorophenolicus]
MAVASFAAGGILETRVGTVRGVLFDIDDTLVDLEYSMTTALREVSEHLLPGLDQSGWERFGRIFTHETTHYYDQYLAGELTFNEQRLLRGRAALGHFGIELADGEESHQWLSAYIQKQPSYVKPFPDVLPLLDVLDRAGIPYGAVSNNVHDYQRAKLDGAGLERVAHLVGTDTLGVAKPNPAIYLEGVRLLGTAPSETLYVGDNMLLDAEGSTAAGLQGVWLNRNAETAAHFSGAAVSTLAELVPLFH